MKRSGHRFPLTLELVGRVCRLSVALVQFSFERWSPLLDVAIRTPRLCSRCPDGPESFEQDPPPRFQCCDDELEDFLAVFDSNPPSNTSSIRLQMAGFNDYGPGERLTHFLSSPFQKLSKLNIGGFLSNPSSIISRPPSSLH